MNQIAFQHQSCFFPDPRVDRDAKHADQSALAIRSVSANLMVGFWLKKVLGILVNFDDGLCAKR